jgi:hypothetical protein
MDSCTFSPPPSSFGAFNDELKIWGWKNATPKEEGKEGKAAAAH